MADVLLCNECAWTNEFPGGSSHFWWHALLPFDSRNLDTLIRNGVEPEALSQLSRDQDSKPTSISVVDGRTVERTSAHIDTSSPLTEILPTANNPEVMELVQEVKGKVLDLDNKTTQRMDNMEAKLTRVEDKLDAIVAELRRVMDALPVTRS